MKLRILLYIIMGLMVLLPQNFFIISDMPLIEKVYGSFMFCLGMLGGGEIVGWIANEVEKHSKNEQ